MITREQARVFVARLGQMKNYPRDNSFAVGELVTAMETSRDEKIAARVVAYFLDNAEPETPCPMPKNVREAVWSIQEPVYEAPGPPPSACPDCHDDGIVGGYSGRSLARWCDCLAGQERKKKQPLYVEKFNEELAETEAKLTRGKPRYAVRSKSSMDAVKAIIGNLEGAR